MRWLQLVTIALLVWGNLAFASLTEGNGSGDSRQELQTISSWMAHLNYYYPDLNVSPSGEDLKDSTTRSELLLELQTLEDVLHGDQLVAPQSLKKITCGNPVCDGGGDGGKCHKCSSAGN